MLSKEKKKKIKDRERLHRKHRAARQDRLHRYRAYSDGSSHVMNPYQTPSSQGPRQVKYNLALERRESFDSYQNLMSEEEPAAAHEHVPPPMEGDEDSVDQGLRQRGPPEDLGGSEEALSSGTFSDKTEEALARRVSKYSKQRKQPKKTTQIG